MRLVVVSNRLPDLDPPGTVSGLFAVGGLVSGVRPALEASGGGIWFGWSGRSARRSSVRATRRGSIVAIALDLSPEDVEGYYNGFCNGALWPLLHSFPTRFAAERSCWERYRRVNARFARALARSLEPGDRIWVHDFHLFPLASELRELGVDAPIGFFLHVPFPPPDLFALLPWARELLDDLRSYDLVGFHTASYAENYRWTVERELGPSAQRTGVYPIGIDPDAYLRWAAEPAAARRGRELRAAVGAEKLILGVDRLDYTKGIPDRLRIFERLLERFPRWRGHVAFVQISAPSRTRVPAYVKQRREVEELVGNLNGRFGDPGWVPVRYLFQSYAQRELAALYREADVALVSPLRDGMNLVAKEFVASQTGDPGVLVLSRFAGAADELAEAVIVNPYDLDSSAEALDRALSMELAERARRQAALLARVREQTAARWGEMFLADLDATRAEISLEHPGGHA